MFRIYCDLPYTLCSGTELVLFDLHANRVKDLLSYVPVYTVERVQEIYTVHAAEYAFFVADDVMSDALELQQKLKSP
ncbi:hypothetical protein [Acinetobacter sp. YH16031]|uniref:hypothetical protein n=1 Tax=Acinetobacter sp. YH16031 TaxID=2601180 RepID=UPI00211F0A16|nr:hypothetical protein [Acinetobacter sp. YH16031]